MRNQGPVVVYGGKSRGRKVTEGKRGGMLGPHGRKKPGVSRPLPKEEENSLPEWKTRKLEGGSPSKRGKENRFRGVELHCHSDVKEEMKKS